MIESKSLTVKEIKATSKAAKKALGKISSIDVYWDYTLRHDEKFSIFRHDLGLKIYPGSKHAR